MAIFFMTYFYRTREHDPLPPNGSATVYSRKQNLKKLSVGVVGLYFGQIILLMYINIMSTT